MYEDYNRNTLGKLSQQKQWFIGNGIKWNRLTVSGYGQAIIQEL